MPNQRYFKKCHRCLHGKNDHLASTKNNVRIIKQCQWDNCDCPMYEGD